MDAKNDPNGDEVAKDNALQLHCPVCLEQYTLDGRTKPKKLPSPCPHTLCQQCVETLPGPTHCPECRRPFDAKAVTDNIALNNAIELISRLSTMNFVAGVAGGAGGACGAGAAGGAGGAGGAGAGSVGWDASRSCDDPDCEEPVVSVCVDDDEWLCEAHSADSNCGKSGKRKGHRVVAPGAAAALMVPMCAQHPTTAVDMYCLECDQILCTKCLWLGGHDAHKSRVQDIAIAADTLRATAADGVKHALSHVTTLDDAIRDVAEAGRALDTASQTTQDDINASFDEAVLLLEARRTELLEEARTVAAARAKALRLQTDELTMIRQSLTGSVEALQQAVSSHGTAGIAKAAATLAPKLASIDPIANRWPLTPCESSELTFRPNDVRDFQLGRVCAGTVDDGGRGPGRFTVDDFIAMGKTPATISPLPDGTGVAVTGVHTAGSFHPVVRSIPFEVSEGAPISWTVRIDALGRGPQDWLMLGVSACGRGATQQVIQRINDRSDSNSREDHSTYAWATLKQEWRAGAHVGSERGWTAFLQGDVVVFTATPGLLQMRVLRGGAEFFAGRQAIPAELTHWLLHICLYGTGIRLTINHGDTSL